MGQKVNIFLYELDSQKVYCSPHVSSSGTLRLIIYVVILYCHNNILDKIEIFYKWIRII